MLWVHGSDERAMIRISEFILRRWGIVGLMNFNAAVGFLNCYVVVQVVRHRDILRWPTLSDLGLTVLLAIGVNLWLVGGLYRDWRDIRDDWTLEGHKVAGVARHTR